MKHYINKELFEKGIAGSIPDDNKVKTYKVIYWYLGEYMLILRRIRGGEINWNTYSKINKSSNIYHSLHKLDIQLNKDRQRGVLESLFDYTKPYKASLALSLEVYKELSIEELCKDVISKEEFEKIYEKLYILSIEKSILENIKVADEEQLLIALSFISTR